METITDATKDVESSRQFLRMRGCLRSEPPLCPKCYRPMGFVKHFRDEKRWKCGTHGNKAVCERSGSLWMSSKLPFCLLIRLLWSWAHQMPISKVPHALGVSAQSAVRWFSILRGICSRKLSSSGQPHSFVDPDTGARTKSAKCLWKNAKRRLKSMKGVHDSMLTGHLDEFIWREKWGKNAEDAFDNILKDISEFYTYEK
eukprot:TRINITY_DN4940_c1_g1_i1.p1 TRINITY_DN4940_c1_g1~~TRINITY_DN4940_c1_g1_i1.p1  ORF type:complete len:200 (-),score=12.66 TRINITY_DN4940_c1_g1_i1:36-635(-)